MASERNRIIELVNYLTSLGIDINIGTTKARGNKGFFMHRGEGCRIDISKTIKEENIIPTLLHEFAHYFHYKHDTNLKSLNFVFGDFTDDLKEELIRVTVLDVPKDFAAALYNKKSELNTKIKELRRKIKSQIPDFKLSEKDKRLEKGFTLPLKYLLKYDRVKIYNKLYSVDNLDADFDLNDLQKDYILLKSKQRGVRRINSRINRLNKYYNNPTELFARFLCLFYTNPEKAEKYAPNACEKFKVLNFPELENIKHIMEN